MYRRIALASLAILCLSGGTLLAQDKRIRQAERKLSAILKDLGDDLRSYDVGLKHFEKVAEAPPLAAACRELVGQADKMSELEKAGRGSGPAVLKLAREMKDGAGKLTKAP